MSLYIHIPYCEAKCHYCDFNSYAGREAEFEALADALCLELRVLARQVRSQATVELPLQTVFLGGGTPSVFPPHLLDRVLATARQELGFAEGFELTSEANPGSLSEAVIEVLLRHGLRRLSLGVQSLDDAQLAALGRVHTRSVALEAIALARRCGVPSLSIDLIFGVPGQSVEQWSSMLDEVLGLGTDHLSLYGLIVEEGTAFGRQHREGRLQVPDDDAQADMFEVTRARLEAAGYGHYEISNYARPGHACRHNLMYWDNGTYAAVGPGAVSYLGGWRMTRLRSPAAYIRAIRGGGSALAEGERVSQAVALAETLMLGLRKLEGVDLGRAWQRHAVDAVDEQGFTAMVDALCAQAAEAGLVERVGRQLKLTRRGVETSSFVMEPLLDLPVHLEHARWSQP